MLIIAGGSLLISIVALMRTHFTERKLKRYQEEEYEKKRINEKKASLRVEALCRGDMDYIAIMNDGISSARNIRLTPESIGNKDGIYAIGGEFPYPVLHSKCRFEKEVCLSQFRKDNIIVTLIWGDNYQKNNEKEFVLSF